VLFIRGSFRSDNPLVLSLPVSPSLPLSGGGILPSSRPNKTSERRDLFLSTYNPCVDTFALCFVSCKPPGCRPDRCPDLFCKCLPYSKLKFFTVQCLRASNLARLGPRPWTLLKKKCSVNLVASLLLSPGGRGLPYDYTSWFFGNRFYFNLTHGTFREGLTTSLQIGPSPPTLRFFF